jgi:uncharacterized protein (DUF58 family)
MTPAADLRAEAERLARQLPGLNFKAEASEAAHIGSAGRRRAGGGETFWQYRRYAQEDDAGRIDWRRSAKGDDLYVRETELETARTVMFWADDHPGFRWKGEGDLRTKAEEAILLMLTMAIPMSKEGERIGSLGTGRRPSFGKRAVDRLANDLLHGTGGRFPEPPRTAATLIIASDFYDPIPEWTARLAPLASKFSRPGTAIDRILGRAETMREEYQRRFGAQREGLEALARQMGWGFVTHVTGRPAIESAARLKAELEQFGAAR